MESQNIAQGTNGYLFSFATCNLTVIGAADQPTVWVSVHNVAEAHLRALDEPKADGKRFLAHSGVVSPLDVAKFARSIQSDLNSSDEPPKTQDHPQYEVFSTTNSQQILGIKYASVESIITEVVEQGIAQRKAGVFA